MRVWVMFLFILTSLFWVGNAYASRWWFVSEDVSGSRYYVDLDSSTVTTENTILLYTKETIKKRKGESYAITKGHKVVSTLTKQEYDCESSTVRTSSIIDYGLQNQVLDSIELEAQDWASIHPDTIGASYLEFACKLKEAASNGVSSGKERYDYFHNMQIQEDFEKGGKDACTVLSEILKKDLNDAKYAKLKNNSTEYANRVALLKTFYKLEQQAILKYSKQLDPSTKKDICSVLLSVAIELKDAVGEAFYKSQAEKLLNESLENKEVDTEERASDLTSTLSQSPIVQYPHSVKHSGQNSTAAVSRLGPASLRSVAGPKTLPVRRWSDSELVDLGPYINDIEKRVRRNWLPSDGTASQVAVFKLVIAKNGGLLSCILVKSSGDLQFDLGAKAAISASAPFRSFPEGVKDSQITINFTLDYALH